MNIKRFINKPKTILPTLIHNVKKIKIMLVIQLKIFLIFLKYLIKFNTNKTDLCHKSL
jgi:hypothetical protein